MRILLTGRNGQVGWELQRSLTVVGQVVPCDRSTADLSRPDTLKALIADVRPDVIVNAAAYTMVDKAEEEEARATIINGEAVGVLAEQARLLGALFVHYSTEYVFDGVKEGAYVESDATNPLNAYGRSKLAGERAVHAAGVDWLVFRTSWVYGVRGKNFLRTMLRLGAERETLNVVADQFGAPTPARMIADVTAHVLREAAHERRAGTFESGILHLTAGGMTSWHGFASKIIDDARARLPAGAIKTKTVSPIPASAYPTPARRPGNSVLDNTKLEDRFKISRGSWEVGTDLVLDDVFEQMTARQAC
ncbi:dTDP-4-dehydrorhamnose reductase [Paraburkholderia hospita]|uniref:dTDP-4-dehydrorhamnose reductase n=1 Tax=Paraburkholderia hospita TaxID=169430 RepID=UPI000B34912A|nr:dTDP-4-dehydrorhamnose reductase [Paraburkholderia hospita]OUL88663.1 dTDP-4-dehydrorhamnose reductase [Paraburkholderia hospita]